MGQIMKARGLNANFVQIPNEILQRKDLSLTAKGLICYLLSLPEDWVICKTKLHFQLKEGRDGVMNAFNELIKEGYILQVQKIGERGRFDYDYVVYNQPSKPEIDRNAFSVNGATVTAEPYTVNPLPYKENNNKEIKKTTIIHTQPETLKAEKETTPPYSAAPPIGQTDFYILPINLKSQTPEWEKWLKSRWHNHGYINEVQQESQIIAISRYCTLHGLDQNRFLDHCLLCAIAGDWKNLNPEIAKRTFQVNGAYGKPEPQKSTYDRKWKGYDK